MGLAVLGSLGDQLLRDRSGGPVAEFIHFRPAILVDLGVLAEPVTQSDIKLNQPAADILTIRRVGLFPEEEVIDRGMAP